MALELKCDRTDRIYRPPEAIDGHMIVTTPSSIAYQGIKLVLTGTVTLQPSIKSVGFLESLYSSIKPIQLVNKTIDIDSHGRINPGRKKFPFHVNLDFPKGEIGSGLLETYHGAYINIQYVLTAEISRGYMLKSISSSLEILVEGRAGKIPRPLGHSHSVYVYITQDTQKHSLLPSICSGGFRVVGRVMTSCCLTDPVVGEITVEHSAIPIRSIDLNLLRIESITLNDRSVSEKTEIQVTQQVADGDVCRGIPLPIFLILPRLLTCPTLSSGSFSIEFAIAITVSFEAEISQFYGDSSSLTPKEWVALETLPLRLLR
ncbi:hypothetical protein KP509_35G037500 [Ceratopteris richardii]|uniref:Down syndrome critical region protein 3 n=1 Tax=Ceratopteris richardii TaxID=49495 RepID=A0A8T2QFB7_CERRI|nr:hypothetical protein KP509_35G037500 [Ceratopteris richardii]